MDALAPTRIQRIVLLVDLHPLIFLKDTTPYLSNIIAAVRRILSFPDISSSLVAYKFFFSSLSPIVSTSKLRHLFGKSPTFLSFDRPAQTLESLLSNLGSLSSIHDSLESVRSACSRASILAGSLLQLEHDYAWDPQVFCQRGMVNSLMVRFNLVLLFSPVPQSPSSLSEYLTEGPLLSFDLFLIKFLQIFSPVKERLVSRDIHVSWIDVSFDRLGNEKLSGVGLFESGVKKLGWGCYRSDAIVLGSALVPFGLIFPYIGYTMEFNSLSQDRKHHAELILCIKDSNGAALDCKICDLGVTKLKVPEERSENPCLFPENCWRGSMRICIREVRGMNGVTKSIENSCALVLLHGIAGAPGKETVSITEEELITKTVLNLLCNEQGELDAGNPIWQIILTFLYNRNYSALVSVEDDGGSSVYGILHPLTLSYALLSIFPKNIDISLSAENKVYDNRKGSKAHTNLLHDASWSSFIERVLSQSDDFASGIFLEDLYFNLPCGRSKKLRFLKCWMKQIKKTSISSDCERNEIGNSSSLEVKEEISSFQQKAEHCSSINDDYLNQPASHSASSFLSIDESNAFLESISQKINLALCTKDVDLFILAERLVLMSIDALCTKYGRNSIEDLSPRIEQNSFDAKLSTEIFDLLLVKPKDLELKCKSLSSTFSTTEPISVIYNNEEIISLHELQILFRMEILRSKLASSIDESVKRKLIKDICLLLQNLEFYLHGDFFGGESLLDYSARTIKFRYEHYLPDAIHEIYDRMEFFTYDRTEVEASDSLPASNDDGPKMCKNLNMNNQNMVNMYVDNAANQQDLDSQIEQQLTEAQERRSRARRFSSFTSWVPDLQRVWALKHPTAEKQAHKTLPKVIAKKRKHWRSTVHDRVCETP